jgi:hypothetical protein
MKNAAKPLVNVTRRSCWNIPADSTAVIADHIAGDQTVTVDAPDCHLYGSRAHPESRCLAVSVSRDIDDS